MDGEAEGEWRQSIRLAWRYLQTTAAFHTPREAVVWKSVKARSFDELARDATAALTIIDTAAQMRRRRHILRSAEGREKARERHAAQ